MFRFRTLVSDQGPRRQGSRFFGDISNRWATTDARDIGGFQKDRV